MHEVAKHLREHALAHYTEDKIDLFVKSACNRYYYSVYLALRDEAFNILDKSKRFEHGAKASSQIHASYKRNIREKLSSMGLEAEKDVFDALVKNLLSKFVFLYELREQSDYYNPTVTVTDEDAKINFSKQEKEEEHLLSDIEKTAYEIIDMIQQLSTYRMMAGL